MLTLLRPEWDKAFLKAAHTTNPKQILHAFCFALEVDPETPISFEFVDELTQWAKEKSAACDHRIRKLTADAAHSIQFDRYGEYCFVRSDDCRDANEARCTHIQHNTTKTMYTLDQNIVFTNATWRIEENWSRYDACLVNVSSDMRQPIFKLFSKDFPNIFKPPARRTAQEKAAATKAARKRIADKEAAFYDELAATSGAEGYAATPSPAFQRKRIVTPMIKRRRLGKGPAVCS